MKKSPGMGFLLKVVMAVLFGLIFALAFPPFGWRLMILPGMAGLIWLLANERGTRARTLGFVHGFSAYAFGLSWLFHIFGVMAIALWCVLAVFTACFAEFHTRAITRGMSGWGLAIFAGVSWCAWEFIRSELFPLRFPWMSVGLAVGPNPLLAWIGVYGVGLLATTGISLLCSNKRIPGVILVLGGCALVNLNPRSPMPGANDGATVKVGGVQRENVSLNEYLADTKSLPADTDLVVWPEFAIPYDIQQNQRDWALLKDLCREHGVILTTGTEARPGGGSEWRNIALTLDENGALGEHTKMHGVHFFDDGTPGEIAKPVKTRLGAIGTPICFDCDYEDVIRKMTAAGAEFIVAPTMDAEKWSARQHDQHAELFRMRACENGRWVFVVATSGVSQLIDPHGNIHVRLGALEQGVLSGSLAKRSDITFYTRWGWMFPWGVLVVAILCWVALLLPVRKKEAFGETV